MKKNMGSLDRTLRIIAGMAIIVSGLYFRSWWGVIGAVPLLTAFFGSCPLYLPFGLSTKGKKTASSS